MTTQSKFYTLELRGITLSKPCELALWDGRPSAQLIPGNPLTIELPFASDVRKEDAPCDERVLLELYKRVLLEFADMVQGSSPPRLANSPHPSVPPFPDATLPDLTTPATIY